MTSQPRGLTIKPFAHPTKFGNTNSRLVSIPAIPEGQLSGIQFFDRNLNFRGPEADRHEVLFPRHNGQSPNTQNHLPLAHGINSTLS